MISFAVVNVHDSDSHLAVWITTQIGQAMAEHTNAVVLDVEDPGTAKKLDDLLQGRHVVVTAPDGVHAGLLARYHAVPLSDVVGAFTTAAQTLYTQVLDSVAAYAQRVRNPNLVQPNPPEAVVPAVAEDDSLPELTLAAATTLARAWRTWLETERERLRRTTNPRTGKRPYMMPSVLGMQGRQVPPEVLALWAAPQDGQASPEALATGSVPA